MTAEECQTALLSALIMNRWYLIDDIIPFLEDMGLTRGQGQADLRTLVNAGKLEKRPYATIRNMRNTPSMEYRRIE